MREVKSFHCTTRGLTTKISVLKNGYHLIFEILFENGATNEHFEGDTNEKL